MKNGLKRSSRGKSCLVSFARSCGRTEIEFSSRINQKNAVKVGLIAVSACEEIFKEEKMKHVRVVKTRVQSIVSIGMLMVFFRKTRQDVAGVVLYLGDSKVFKFKLFCGGGANTREELLVLWGFLHFAQLKNIDHLQMAEALKLIID